MRVTFNSFPDTLLGRLQALGGDQNKALTQLSTGQRIAAPSDDAPAMQRILNLRVEKKQNQQFYRNAIDGLEKSKVTFSSLEQIKDLLVRASELAAGVNGATSEQEFFAKGSEIDQLIEQGLNVANTKLRGAYLFSGDAPDKQAFVAERSTDKKISQINYDGSSDESEIRIGEDTMIKVGATAGENAGVANILNEMIRMRDTMLSSDPNKVLSIRAQASFPGTFAATTASTPPAPPVTSINLPTGHGLKVDDKIKPASAVGGLDPSKTYYVRSVNNTANTVELSETPNGPAVPITANIPAGSAFERIGGFGELENNILSSLSRSGTVQYRLEVATKDLETRYDATEQLISTDADIDFAEATVRLNRSQMAYQAAIQSGAMIQSNSLLDYIR